ncbi:hypothetical protein [Microbacterium sp. GXF6406]
MADHDMSSSEARQRATWGIGIALGMVVGVAMGSALDNMGVGIAIGIAVGLVVAIGIMQIGRRRHPGAPEDAPDAPSADGGAGPDERP